VWSICSHTTLLEKIFIAQETTNHGEKEKKKGEEKGAAGKGAVSRVTEGVRGYSAESV